MYYDEDKGIVTISLKPEEGMYVSYKTFTEIITIMCDCNYDVINGRMDGWAGSITSFIPISLITKV